MKPLLIALLTLAAPALAQEAPRPVVSEIVTADPVQARAFSGVIEGQEVTMLAFQTTGRLATLEVGVGDRVSEGDVLATLDEITLEQDVAAAKAALASAQAEADLAQSRYDRTSELLSRGVATEAQLEQARAARDATAAQVDSARADLARAEDAARYGTLAAPHDAIVLATLVEAGSTVSPGTPVVQIANPEGREAVIDVPSAFVEVLPEGSLFEVRHHAEGVPPVEARLRVVEPVADTGLDTRRLRLTLTDPPADYRIGSLVTARYSNGAQPVMTLPASAIVEAPDGATVWRVLPDRTVARVPVTLGPRIGDRVVIAEGIEVGDEIVTRGVNSLEDGQKVGARIE